MTSLWWRQLGTYLYILHRYPCIHGYSHSFMAVLEITFLNCMETLQCNNIEKCMIGKFHCISHTYAKKCYMYVLPKFSPEYNSRLLLPLKNDNEITSRRFSKV